LFRDRSAYKVVTRSRVEATPEAANDYKPVIHRRMDHAAIDTARWLRTV